MLIKTTIDVFVKYKLEAYKTATHIHVYIYIYKIELYLRRVLH